MLGDFYAMKFCDNTTERSPARQHAATAFGVLTLLCAVPVVLGFISGILGELFRWEDASYGGIGSVLFYIITLPVALLSTLFAILLGGTRQSRLAWITFCAVYLPFTAFIVIFRFIIHR